MFFRGSRTMGPEEQAATATINSKLRRLDNRKVDVDRYWGEMEYTKRPPQVDQVFSPKRQRTIPTIPNRTNTAFDEGDKSIYEEPVQSEHNRPWTSEVDVLPRNVQRKYRTQPVGERISRVSQNQLQNSTPSLHYAEIGPSSDGPRNYRTQPERVERVSQNHLQTSVPNLHYADIGSSSDAPSNYGVHPVMERVARVSQNQLQASAPNLHYAEIDPYGDHQQRSAEEDPLKRQLEEVIIPHPLIYVLTLRYYIAVHQGCCEKFSLYSKYESCRFHVLLL